MKTENITNIKYQGAFSFFSNFNRELKFLFQIIRCLVQNKSFSKGIFMIKYKMFIFFPRILPNVARCRHVSTKSNFDAYQHYNDLKRSHEFLVSSF